MPKEPLQLRILRYRSEPNLVLDLKINNKVYRYEKVNRFDHYVIQTFLRKKQNRKVIDYVKAYDFPYEDVTQEYSNYLTGIKYASSPYKEFTIKDFKNASSPLTRTHRVVRNVVKGQEGRLAKLVDYDFKKNIMVFLTPPTFRAPAPNILNGRITANRQLKSLYMMQIQLVEIDKWKGKKWQELTLAEFKDILKVVDVKFDCTCSSFHWQGMRYKLSRLKSAIFPTTISDPVWGKAHQQKNGLCKHLLGLANSIDQMSPQLLTKLKQLAKAKKIENL
jgi:hypothetical protein